MKGKPVNKELAIDLYKKGLSFNEIGRQLGHHHSVIAYHIYKSGLPIRKGAYYRTNPVKTEFLIKLYEKGNSLPEISKKVGLTNQAIFQRLIKANVKLRSISEALKLGYKTGKIKKYFGKDNQNWKGGRFKDKNGYIQVNIGNHRSSPEHRIVWEKAHGKIPKGYIIHHLNGIRDDNRLGNLTALPRKRHSPNTIIEPYRKRIKELEKQIKNQKSNLNNITS